MAQISFSSKHEYRDVVYHIDYNNKHEKRMKWFSGRNLLHKKTHTQKFDNVLSMSSRHKILPVFIGFSYKIRQNIQLAHNSIT